MKHRFSLFCYLVLIVLSSCQVSDNSAFKVKPSALGVMNEIVIISDDDIWNGPIGDSLDYYFGGPYPITPQPEPLFDLRHFTPQELISQPLRKELRTYLIVADLSDESSETTQMVKEDFGEQGINRAMTESKFQTSIGRNKWATGQILIYLFSNGFDNLSESVGANFSSIATRVKQHDDEQLTQSTYSRGTNKGLSNEVALLIGTAIEIPSDYVVAKKLPEENSIWLRKDTKEAILNIVLSKKEYISEDQLSNLNMKETRDIFGKTHVSSNAPDSYMITNDVDLPILEYDKQINGLYVKEFRGIWEMENDFMGGPFLTYFIINGKDLIYIDAFILAQGADKRDYLQQIEKVVSSLNKPI